MKKYSLVLSGGGFKGAFQVGALNYILSNPIQIDGESIQIQDFDIVTGVSVGSLNGALVGTGQLETLNKLWFEEIAENGPGIVYTSELVADGKPQWDKLFGKIIPKIGFFKLLGLAVSQRSRAKLMAEIGNNIGSLKSLADNTPLLNTLNQYVSRDKFGDTLYKMGYVSLVDGAYSSKTTADFETDHELNKAILASTTAPIIWPPVPAIHTKGQELYKQCVDGGIRNVTPLKDAIEEINKDTSGANYHIIIINCHGALLEPEDKDYNIVDTAYRALAEITLAEIFQNDVEHFLFINKMLTHLNKGDLQMDGKTYRKFGVSIIQPEATLGNILDTSKSILLQRRDLGYQQAAEVLGNEALV